LEAYLVNLTDQLKKNWDLLEGTGTMRASLFNLIVVVPDSTRRPYVKTITDNVIKRFPCRVIFITIIDEIDSIKMHASATSEIEGVACDLIEIAAPSLLLHKIPFLILPHFLPDMPIYLLWAEAPSAHPELFNHLCKWASRLIYDSEVSDNLPLFCTSLLAKTGTREVADLNWARTESWRELIAATFYSPARLSSLRTAQKVEIQYNNFETPFFCHTKIQALYLQAWLTSCLSWSPTITFVPHVSKELAPGAVISIDIICQDQFHYTFSRDPHHPHQVRTLICDEDKCDIPSRYIFSKAQSGLSLVNLIYHPDPSTHFLKVLQYLEGHP
jgi:glucose-6-phosphate dehydrogenase assembly protein OpcA